MADNDEITKCYTCEVLFDDMKNIPRLLPCSDTLCQLCIQKSVSISPNHLKCPVCKMEHVVSKGTIESFPQNKYVLHIINLLNKSRLEPQQTEIGDIVLARCKEHNRELGLYCNEVSCKKPICQKCFLGYHRTHSIIDIDEKDKFELIEAVKDTQNKIKLVKEKLNILKNEQDSELMKRSQCLESARFKIIGNLTDVFKYQSNSLTDYRDLYKSQMQGNIESLDTQLQILNDLKKREFVYPECHNLMETVNNIRDNAAGVMKEVCALKLPECQFQSEVKQTKLLKTICGNIEQEKMSRFLASHNTQLEIGAKQNFQIGMYQSGQVVLSRKLKLKFDKIS